VLRVYREREAIGYADGHAYVAIFKNSGSAAGASLRHPHAQVVALRAVPCSIVARIERLGPQCEVCAMCALADGADNVVFRAADVVAYVPDGSRTAFEVRIAPRRHASRFSQSSDAEPQAIAVALDEVMKRLAAALGEDVPFNIIVQSAPRDPRAEALLHWEIEVVPRVENFGGYELGAGGYLVSRLPEDAARVLRAAGAALRA
jgi:UDPglucose--hexose-1-phosphate uridylyltransferase